MKVLVSMPLPGNAIPLIQSSGHELLLLPEGRTPEAFFNTLPSSDAVLSMLSDQFSAEVIRGNPQLRAIANYAVGFNNIDLPACLESGIVVTNTPDVLTDATADVAMTLILCVLRRIPASLEFLREGHFKGWKPDILLGHDPKKKILGILGMGRIGSAVAHRAAAFGMKIVYHSRSGKKTEAPGSPVSFQELLQESDVLSLHTPLTAETRYLIGAKELAAMKKGAILINTARGPIVDEAALADSLIRGHLFGAGLDVFEHEPAVHPDLWKAPNITLLPHIGSGTCETRSAMGEMAATSLLEVLKGGKPANTVNPDVYETKAWKARAGRV